MGARGAVWAAIGLMAAARFAHHGIVWVEEAYPAAAAIQMLHGLLPYRDFFFDKPPLSALAYLLWGGFAGWPLRAAGALFVIGCAWLAEVGARREYGERAGLIAAGLTGFFLTFDFPAATIALSPDILLVAPHLAAFACLAAGAPFAAGAMAGLAILLHSKGLFVLAFCLIWVPRRAGAILAGCAAPVGITAAALAAVGALGPMWEQVWVWGSAYATDTFVARPLHEGGVRTLSWVGFHLTLVVGAFVAWSRCRRLLAWALLSLVTAGLGLRFFPRYYFQLLPPMVIAAAMGLSAMTKWRRAAALALLAIPLVRFGPRYVQLAANPDAPWGDVAMNVDSRQAAAVVNSRARPQDTILVWGYRPDILVYTRLRLGAPYLDSQPLTGVLADRHLTSTHRTYDRSVDRKALTQLHPTFLVDGLGPYNPALAITAYPELREWLGVYREVGRTRGAIVYRLAQ